MIYASGLSISWCRVGGWSAQAAHGSASGMLQVAVFLQVVACARGMRKVREVNEWRRKKIYIFI